MYQFEWFPKKIISGGQTGVDRAALDWACQLDIPHGGWCPKGRLATDGALSLKYQLRETESAGYRQRTKLNVRDSDATLVLNVGDLDGGTLQTVHFITSMRRPHRVIQLECLPVDEVAKQIETWLEEGNFQVLNIAGPREEMRPGIYSQTFLVLNSIGNGC